MVTSTVSNISDRKVRKIIQRIHKRLYKIGTLRRPERQGRSMTIRTAEVEEIVLNMREKHPEISIEKKNSKCFERI